MTDLDKQQLAELGINSAQLAQIEALGLDRLFSGVGELFSVEGIALMLIFSIIGLIYFKQGRKQGDTVKLICGIGLLAYGYLVSQFITLILFGVILIVIPYLRRFF